MPWQIALDVTSDTIKSTPLFGAGPNNFTNEFLLNKPLILNSSNFWNIEFNSGSGFISTFFVTHGVVGGVLWILFLVFFFILGIKSLRKYNEIKNYPIYQSTFFLSSFLWIVLLINNPSHVIIFFTFIVTGLFIGIICYENILKVKEYKYWMKVSTIIILIIVILWTTVYIRKAVALAYFQSGVGLLNNSQNRDIEKIENNFKNSLIWDESDIYYQALSEINIVKINTLTQQNQNKDLKDIDPEVIKKVGEYINDAVTYANKAITIDPENYYNYISAARVYELAALLQIENAYENSKSSYTNAIKLNPYNPSLYLSLAKLEASRNNMTEAQKYIGNALQLKQNYIEAIFLLSQIQVSQGQIKEAINSVKFATQINTNDPLLFFQLGLLHYNDKNYKDAVDALLKAVTLNDQYANARYFLGLSYARLNKYIDAVEQFEKIAETNPDNNEVNFILSNLKVGKSPFTDVKAPVDNKPEKRSTLPIKEKTTK